MDEKKLRQLFKNRSNCYASSEEVIQAMDEHTFIETIKEALSQDLFSEPKELSFEEKNTIHQRAKAIVNSEALTWKQKYDLIFSDEISKQFDFNWYDPDTDYEEDVQAFMTGLDDYMELQLIIYKL